MQRIICGYYKYKSSVERDLMIIEPLYKSVSSDGKEIAYPLLSNIPVMSCYLGKDISIIPSYENGDLVLVSCSTFNNSKQLKKETLIARIKKIERLLII